MGKLGDLPNPARAHAVGIVAMSYYPTDPDNSDIVALIIAVMACAIILSGGEADAAEWEPPEWATSAGAWVEDHTGGGVLYFEAGVAWQFDNMSDYYLRTEREWQCSQNWQAHFEFGLDWGKAQLGYHHQSWWVCGGPWWNDRPELYSDALTLTYRWGGK